MSLSHFLKLNENTLKQDLFLVNNTYSFNNFQKNSPSNLDLHSWQSYFHEILGNNKIIEEYWKYKLKFYRIKYQQVEFPILYTTSNLVDILELDIYRIEELYFEDFLIFYFPQTTLEFKLNITVQGSSTDGFEFEISWKLLFDTDNLIDKFWEILRDKNKCRELSQENKLWEILLENGNLEENVIRENLEVS